MDGKKITFLGKGRPNRRSVNTHASKAFEKAKIRMEAVAAGATTLEDVELLPESVWSGNSWKERVKGWKVAWHV